MSSLTSNQNKLDPKDEELRKKLLATVKVYKSRNWIDDIESDGFRSLLSPNGNKGCGNDFVPSVQSLETTKKRLLGIKKDRLREESTARKESRRKDRDRSITPQKKTTSLSSLASISSSSSPRLLHASSRQDRQDSERMKVPIQIHESGINTAEDVAAAGILSDEETGKLFTEMCVFARMSLSQPTSCLNCLYDESILRNGEEEDVGRGLIEGKEELKRRTMKMNTRGKTSCDNLVVWRKNANICLHPEKLRGNLLIVSCKTARALMRGKTVQGMKWDKRAKEVIRVNSNTDMEITNGNSNMQ